MPPQSDKPFESIESTYDFFRLLSDSVADAKHDIQAQIESQSTSKSRRVDALRITSYSLEKLESHVTQSRRILNDLRSLRRLLFEERAAPKVAARPEPLETEKPVMPGVPLPAALPSQVAKVARVRAKAGSAVAA